MRKLMPPFKTGLRMKRPYLMVGLLVGVNLNTNLYFAEPMTSEDFSAYMLSPSQLNEEVDSEERLGRSQPTPGSGNLPLDPASPSPPAVSAHAQLGQNPHEGWANTPPGCICNCPKEAYVVFHGKKTGIFNSW
jgi:hypothetical protein